MDLKEVKRLVELVESANISQLSIDSDGTKIEIKKELSGVGFVHAPVAVAHAPAPVAAPVAAAPVTEKPAASETDHLIAVKAQMVGTFYSSPSPDAPAFVKVGDTIKQGQVVCIIEAMKLFNEIESDQAGTVEKVCLSSGAAVEYGQVLFWLRP
jgi:acetyl-CoA carboxylase biotin carboxyl carrier protein